MIDAKSTQARSFAQRALGRLGPSVLASLLLVLWLLPLLALSLSVSCEGLIEGVRNPAFLDALSLSLRTTTLSLLVTALLGTPLAWRLHTHGQREGRHGGPRRWRVLRFVAELPILLPPAVVGLGLLLAFGRQGPFGSVLAAMGLSLPFTEGAVVIAQVVVAAPFYVLAAADAFGRVDPEMVAVARTLGASPQRTFFRVVLPLARPGLLTGLSLAWARALGEFGATLLFAGNLPGRSQTLPLAVFATLEGNVEQAVVLALLLVAIGTFLLLALRRLGRGGPLRPPRHHGPRGKTP